VPRLADASARLPFFGGIEPPAGRGPRLAHPERLELAATTLPGIGPRIGESLASLGLETVKDVLYHRPRRYEPPAQRVRIADLLAGHEATIEVEVVQAAKRPTRRRRLTIVEALVRDGSGSLQAIWFNQAWLADRLQAGTRARLRGSIEKGAFVVRDYDLEDDDALSRIAPIYPASEAISSKRLRDLILRTLPLVFHIPDPMPAELRQRLALPLKRDAIEALHLPASIAQAEQSRRRLALEELLVLQLGLARRRSARTAGKAPKLGEHGELIARYRTALPFSLTAAQERAIAQIDEDLDREAPMERLLQGDVGSGKTVVALYALLRAVEHGHQATLMAPTETLAEQHFLTIEGLCQEIGVSCRLLTSSLPSREAGAARDGIANGTVDVAVGTHALIQEDVRFRSLGVAVVDEQHRFGVAQRAALATAGGASTAPHRLHMTATPIPRTLALTVWGDLAVSEIDRPPEGRKPVVTGWITHERSSEAYVRLRRLLEEGRQAFVVCPLVSPSEAIEAKAAEAEAARLTGAELAGFRVGCLHGRLRPAERRGVMAQFAAHELDVLVATTVIEVGVDVPNATIMIVQEADRFGLAQLHQLRGRVGRGSEQSYCLLVSRRKEELTDIAAERLQALVDIADGFELAEVDLELRGAGQFLGTRQSGLTDLRFTRLRSDRGLLEQARAEVGAVQPGGPLDDEVTRMFGEGVADRLP
jgi:ATP-dependent DNA helicase RecG